MSLSPSLSADLSRARLRNLSRWIRDDLDLLVARKGPNVLRPDDVLTLHETFVALRHATNITALDLRATGIHKAVQDISGVATRWPGRLCDDCDKIIALWTARFGPFSELHPFLYGRGGRLEGIASAAEYTREALLKRWSETCPEKLHPKHSHRLGDLGFRAGDWWINTLFAHHAGIIGLEGVEGGTTFDKHGAYALVLKDTGEVEANSEESFIYRCPQNDKGKFRLTAATPRSRDPIRVLRSHSINSVWGPRAGVRFDGLFSVKGWSIRTAKTADAAGGQWKEGDIVFEVRFERHDPTPMDEVAKRPTATEVDDYSEYKRLRKLHRDTKRKALDTTESLNTHPQLARAAPQIAPPEKPAPKIEPPKELRPGSPSRKPTFKRPHFDIPEGIAHNEPDLVSPMTVPNTDQFPLVTSSKKGKAKATALALPPSNSDTASNGSSSQTAASNRPTIDIRDVAPWIDFDPGLALPSPAEASLAPLSPTGSALKLKGEHRRADDSPGPVSMRRGKRRNNGDFKELPMHLNLALPKPKDSRKSIFVRSHNPMAKLFDGAASRDDEVDYFGPATYESRSASLDARCATPKVPRRMRATSSDGAIRVHSPVPLRPFSFETPFVEGKRDSFYATEDFAPIFPVFEDSTSYNDDPFTETSSSRYSIALPMSMISQPRTATSINSSPSTSVFERQAGRGGSGDTTATRRLRKMVGDMKATDVKIVFRNPFSGSPRKKKKDRKESGGGVAPHVI